jgi:hypothetical protein
VREPSIGSALAHIAAQLRRLSTPFALVGGLGVSARAEVRFTRDVDVVISVADDASVERIVRELGVAGYRAVALVEHDARRRLATARLASPDGFVVDLIAASSGIEDEIVAASTLVHIDEVGDVPVASAEHLLAMKVLAMTERRLQDRSDARSLVLTNPRLDIGRVRDALRAIAARGYDRGQDLEAKLEGVLEEARCERE